VEDLDGQAARSPELFARGSREAASDAGSDEPAPRARRGASADDVRRVLAYVPAVARRYAGYGVDFDELVAAGNFGLVKAALRFDPERKIKFITYAGWWIRKAILEALEEQVVPFRIPRYQQEKLRALRAARADYLSRIGDEPDEEQLAEASGIPREDAELLLRFLSSTVSLEQPLAPGDDRPLKELLPDAGSENPQGSLVRRELAQRLRGQLASLGQREREVISMRFGFGRERPLTLREVGRRLGISRERVRQVELRALVKLRRMV
jgi:RNA polymerase primary sigma factor